MRKNFSDTSVSPEDMVDVILGYHGSLRAEHGTGRIMAPFIERQFGSGVVPDYVSD